MKRTISIGIMLFFTITLVVMACGCHNETTPTPSTSMPSLPSEVTDTSEIYSNTYYNFSVRYCSEMEIQENTGVAVAFAGDMLGDMAHYISISVVTKELPKKTTLRDYIEQNKQAGQEALQDYETVSEEETTVAGIPAIKVIYSFSTMVGDYDYVFKNTMTSFIKDDTIYNIMYSVPDENYDQYKDCYDLILYTFTFN